MSEYTRKFVENANYGMPTHDDPRWIYNIEKYLNENNCSIKKVYFEREIGYGSLYSVEALTNGKFLLFNNGSGRYLCDSWEEAVGMRRLFVGRWKYLERSFGY